MRQRKKLARGWSEEPDTLAFLKSRTECDENSGVRGTAVKELAGGRREEPGIFELLRDRALKDPFQRSDRLYNHLENNPREVALEAIAQYYPHHPDTLALFSDKAENDPDEEVRDFARRTLERWR